MFHVRLLNTGIPALLWRSDIFPARYTRLARVWHFISLPQNLLQNLFSTVFFKFTIFFLSLSLFLNEFSEWSLSCKCTKKGGFFSFFAQNAQGPKDTFQRHESTSVLGENNSKFCSNSEAAHCCKNNISLFVSPHPGQVYTTIRTANKRASPNLAHQIKVFKTFNIGSFNKMQLFSFFLFSVGHLGFPHVSQLLFHSMSRI